MQVISVIEDENVIKKILKHLGLWDQQASARLRDVILTLLEGFEIQHKYR